MKKLIKGLLNVIIVLVVLVMLFSVAPNHIGGAGFELSPDFNDVIFGAVVIVVMTIMAKIVHRVVKIFR